MSYKVKFTGDGFEVEAETPEDLRRLLLMGNAMPATLAPRPVVVTKGPQGRVTMSEANRRHQTAITLLHTIRDKGPLVSSEVITKAVGYKQTRALGRLGLLLRYAAKRHKIDFNDAIHIRTIDSRHFWGEGPRFAELLGHLERERA